MEFYIGFWALIIVLTLPQSGSKLDEKEGFWNDLNKLVIVILKIERLVIWEYEKETNGLQRWWVDMTWS